MCNGSVLKNDMATAISESASAQVLSLTIIKRKRDRDSSSRYGTQNWNFSIVSVLKKPNE